MLTNKQISEIDEMLHAGRKPEKVAAHFGMTYGQLRASLLNSGKRWEVVSFRRLVDTAPARDVETNREQAAA